MPVIDFLPCRRSVFYVVLPRCLLYECCQTHNQPFLRVAQHFFSNISEFSRLSSHTISARTLLISCLMKSLSGKAIWLSRGLEYICGLWEYRSYSIESLRFRWSIGVYRESPLGRSNCRSQQHHPRRPYAVEEARAENWPYCCLASCCCVFSAISR